MNRIALVGCGAKKADRPMPARQLYTGPLFTAARGDVERRGLRWWIVSAKHGLVEPDRILEPYDLRLADVASRTGWAMAIVAELRVRVELRGLTIELHAGRDYVRALETLLRAEGAIVEDVAIGLQIGERLRLYAERAGRGPRATLHDAHQARVTPGPRERGHRPTAKWAEELLGRAIPLSEDPDVAQLWHYGAAYREGAAELAELDDEEHDVLGFTYGDLPELLGVGPSPRGESWTHEERVTIAEQALLAGVQVRHGLPTWIAAATLEDVIERRAQRLVAVPREVAAEFIAEHHSKLPKLNERGLMYSLGVVANNRLVAVATAGTPTGRWRDPHRVLELTRVASDRSVKGAASMLVARLLDLVATSSRTGATGPALFVTYSLTSEEGTTYRALRDKGLRPVAFIPGKTHKGGARVDTDGALAQLDKIRWEAGPGAGTADWTLLQPRRPSAGELVDRVAAALTQAPPAGIDAAYVAAFFRRRRRALVAEVRRHLPPA